MKTQESPLPVLDLSNISLNPDRWDTELYITLEGRTFKWLQLGEVDLTRCEGTQETYWVLATRIPGAFDIDHDQALGLNLGLVGVELNRISESGVIITGWIRPNIDTFLVPDQGYDPRKEAGTTQCPSCIGAEAHLLIPDNRFAPDPNHKVFAIASGKYVVLEIRPR